MVINFIFSNINIIFKIILIIFWVVIFINYFQIKIFKNISIWKFVFVALGLHIFYGLFISWGQYHVWATSVDFTRFFVNTPLPKEVPMASIFEWSRPLFENNYGFYLFYIIGRFWTNIFISFLLSSFVFLIFKMWNSYRGGFSKNGPELFLVLMLIVGYPGILVLLPLGFIFSIFNSLYFLYKKEKNIKIESSFLIASIFTLLFTNIILSYVL